MKKQGPTTRLLNTPYPKEDPHGSLNFPVYESVAFEAESSEELEAAFTGRTQRHLYSRITNPTIEYFESKVRTLTGAFAVTAMSSGMAAISNLFIALGKSGDNIITSRHLFGNTLSLLEKTLRPYGLETRLCDLTDAAAVEALVDERTIAVYFETITNPQLEVVDISSLKAITKKQNILLIADTTLTPPSFFSAAEHGIDFELISSTKFISGGATSVGGLLIDYGSYDWSTFEKTKKSFELFGKDAFKALLRKQVYRNLGACISPASANLQSLGLDTLALRTDRATSNALELARWLEKQDAVKSVHHPGLESSPFHDMAIRQFGARPTSIFTFDLESKQACYTFMNKLKILRRATNLQDNKTLVIHPWATIFAEYPDQEKIKMGLRDTTIRITVGIEEVQDLMDDMEQALR